MRVHVRVTLLFEGANLTRLGQGDKTIHEKRQYVKCWQFFEDIPSSSIFIKTTEQDEILADVFETKVSLVSLVTLVRIRSPQFRYQRFD